MALFSKRGALSTLILLHFLLLFPSYLFAIKPSAISNPAGIGLTHPVSITTSESEYGITIDILGNADVLEYQTAAVSTPPMIVIDILRHVDSFKTATIPLKSNHLKDIRLGYHPEKIRVVLDIQGSRIPPFSTETINHGLSLFLRSDALGTRRQPVAKEAKIKKGEESSDSHEKKKHDNPPKEEMSPLERLTQIEQDDGEEDTTLYLTGIHAYQDQNWSTAIDSLDHLLKTQPAGRYAERAHFLIAKACEKQYSDSIDAHFAEIKNRYTEAVRKFPESMYASEALLSLGDLYNRVDNPFEALAYYKQVQKNEPDSRWSMKATIGIARIMARRNERQKAVNLLGGIVDKYPESKENIDARLEMAKILYEMNHFLKSLEILSGLRQTNPENRYRFPELSLYLGYNFYQLGENNWSRENLLRFYNSRPDREPNHLILTKIGDTYREEGALNEAAKFYNLVIARYPETEGAVISRIRLAELKEEGTLGANGESASYVNLVGGEEGSAREIYEKILETPFEQDQRKPLEQLTLLRLAILQQSEKDYEKSLETLHTLF